MSFDIVKIETGIRRYRSIMDSFRKVDVSKDLQFQKSYNGFYRVRQLPQAFYECYYAYMEDNKYTREFTFEQVLNYLYAYTGKVHASFGSKLLATIRPEMPLWDQYVLGNLGLKMPSYYRKENRLDAASALYQQICEWYQSDDAAELVFVFDRLFPKANISDVKKIDFLLWQSR